MQSIQRKYVFIFIALFFIIFLIVGCSDEESTTENRQYYSVSGTIKVEEEAKEPGEVDLKIRFETGRTKIVRSKADGSWEIPKLWGKVVITPVKENYDFSPGKITVKNQEENLIFHKKEALNYEEMVFVEGDSFQLGSEEGFGNESPQNEVSVSSFYIRKYPVTQKEYKKVIGHNPAWHTREKHPDILWANRRPVEKISWWEAIEFANKLSRQEDLAVAYDEDSGKLLDDQGKVTDDVTEVEGYRLPTEAEWEFAARGGKDRRETTYAGSDVLDEVGWYFKNSFVAESGRSDGRATMPVGRKSPNELGLYDMSGNVWEWVQDYYDRRAYEKIQDVNPYLQEGGVSRVYRGGSWYHFAYRSRVSFRGRYNPDFNCKTVGFRLVKSK